MSWLVGSDHAGRRLRGQVAGWLQGRGEQVAEVGPASEEPVDYPPVAATVAHAVAAGQPPRAVLCCGTGVGMAVAANRVAGVRAVVCESELTARRSREHNDANVLCLGEQVLGAGLAETILGVFVGTHFAGGRHARRVALIEQVAAAAPRGEAP